MSVGPARTGANVSLSRAGIAEGQERVDPVGKAPSTAPGPFPFCIKLKRG
jgi:hypothetical protein